jgi:hypothetical protein
MNKTTYVVLLAAVLPLLVSISPVTAGVLMFNEATGGTGSNNDQSIGWQFNVVGALTVTDLEWYDPTRNGLNTAHMVGIWNPAGALVTSALIPAGTAAGLDGMFRFVSVTPVLLAAGNGYIVGGENFANNIDRVACGTGPGGPCDGLLVQVLDPTVVFVNASFSTAAGFQRPTILSSAHEGFYGPSFSAAAIPEPSSMLLLVAGLVGLATTRRRLWVRNKLNRDTAERCEWTASAGRTSEVNRTG